LKDDFTLAFLTRWRCQTLTASGTELRAFLGPLLDNSSTGKWIFVEFTTDYGDACVKLGEQMADVIYYPQEKGPPSLEMPFICP